MQPTDTEPQTDLSQWHEAEPSVEPASQLQYSPAVPAGLPRLPLWRQVLALAVWPLLEQFMGATVGFVDTALAGRLDPAATEAIGSAGYVIWLMGIMQGAVGVGSTAVIARAVGANRYGEADHALGQSILLALIWGAFNLLLFHFAAPLVAMATSLQGHAAGLCTMYLQVLALVAPLRAVLYIGSACLRGAGDTKSPFLVMLAVNVLNIVLSIALVAQFSPIGGMGLRGVAVGTTVSWLAGGLIMAGLLARGAGGVRLRRRHMRPNRPMTGRLVRIGAPALVENGLHWAGNLIVIVMVGSLATLGLAERPMGSQIIAIRIEAFSFLLGFAFNVAAATVAGQYLGAGDAPNARRAGWVSWAYGAAVMVSFGVLFMAIPEALTRIFTDQQPFLTDVPRMIFHAGWAQIGFATYLVLAGVLRGSGDTRTTMWLTLGSTFLVRLPLVWVLGITLELGLTGVWIALAVELVFRGVLFLARFLHGGWTHVRV
ncbi:MAG: MATE family efflux transporter [Alphaproteobacteria bacterium]|jgi:putative MATE family efflux protein|nr:MATE family efflux transporter [Alphaproteobacteria bacterium]